MIINDTEDGNMKIRIKIKPSRYTQSLYIGDSELLLYKPRNYKKLRERNKIQTMITELQDKIFRIDAHEI